MKKMMIYDPAMCCSTGVCGPSVDKNLLRVATTVSSLIKKGVRLKGIICLIIPRHTLTT